MRLLGQIFNLTIEKVREGETKTSQKSKRSERSKRHERPTRPKRLKTRTPKIPLHQEHPPGIAPEQGPQKTQVTVDLLRVWIRTIWEGVTKTSKKVNRSDGSKSPKTRLASAPPNYLRKLQSPRLRIGCPPCLNGRLDGNQVEIENAKKKGA